MQAKTKNLERSYYSGGFLRNVIQIGRNAEPSTVAHELFHQLDRGHKISKTLEESLTKDYVSLNVKSGGEIKDYLLEKFPHIFETSKQGVAVMRKPYRGIADILNGLSSGKVYYGYGHEEAYWAKTGSLEAEAWAQFGRILFENDKEVIEMLKSIFPTLYESAILKLKEVM